MKAYDPKAIADAALGANAGRPPITLDVVKLSEVERQRVTWLWEGRLPLGKVVVVEGDPGLGKSTLTVDWAARVTTGAPFPHSTRSRAPGTVLFLTYEDGVADTIRPRAEAAGADCSRILMFRGVAKNGDESLPPTLPNDVPVLRQLIELHGVQLVVIDPWNAAVAGGSSGGDSGKAVDMRKALIPVARMAEETNCLVVILRHFTKSGSGRAINAGSGSIDIAGQARVVLAVHRDPGPEGEDAEQDTGARVLCITKNNLAPHAPSLAWHLEDRGGAGCVVWDGTSTHSADTLSRVRMGDTHASSAAERGEKGRAMTMLRDLLAAGPMAAVDANRELAGAGFKAKTIQRAREALGIDPERIGGREGGWRWSLPKKVNASEGGQEDHLDHLDHLPAGTPVRVLFGGEWVTTTSDDPDIHRAERVEKVAA